MDCRAALAMTAEGEANSSQSFLLRMRAAPRQSLEIDDLTRIGGNDAH
jgi:hypothetical protein